MDPSEPQAASSEASQPEETSTSSNTRKIAQPRRHRRFNSTFTKTVSATVLGQGTLPAFDLPETPFTVPSTANRGASHKRGHSTYDPYKDTDDTKKGRQYPDEFVAGESIQPDTAGNSTQPIIGTRYEGSPEPEEQEEVVSNASDFDYDEVETDTKYRDVKVLDPTDDWAVREAINWHNEGNPEKLMAMPELLKQHPVDPTEDQDLADIMSGLGSTKARPSVPGAGDAMTEEQE